MTDVIMGNIKPLKDKIESLEREVKFYKNNYRNLYIKTRIENIELKMLLNKYMVKECE